MRLNIVICEDNLVQRLNLKEYLSKVLEEENLKYNLSEYSSGEELMNNYDKDKVDILFLDINLGTISGMDVARKIRTFDKKVEIVFITAIERYVFEAYEVRAYRYLIKPIHYEELKKQVKFFIADYLAKKNFILIESNKVTVKIPIEEILYAEVVKKEVTIYTETKEYVIEITMKKIEEKLSNYVFYRSHNSFLVNLNKITELKDKAIYIKDKEIPVSRGRYRDLKMRLVNLWVDSLC